MSSRLTINEFEFLKEGLCVLEKVGIEYLMGNNVTNTPALLNFFGTKQADIIGNLNSLQILRDKIDLIAGD